MKDDCQIVVFEADIPWATSEQVLRPVQTNRNQWSRIFSTALDDLVGLVSPKRIVYCEGKDKPGIGNQEKGLDAQVYNNIFGGEYPETLFVSSGGNTELDQRSNIAISILGKVFPSVEILVCKDRDMSSGVLNSEEDRLLYLKNNPGNHRVIKRWEIENYLYDKEVLQHYCDVNGLDFDETNYDAFVTDIYNQNLKDETAKIRNFCNLHMSINSERFKIELSKCVLQSMAVYKELEDCIFKRL